MFEDHINFLFDVTVKRYICSGIEATMTPDASHLCAMGLTAYTEIMGGFVTGNLHELRHSKTNFDGFLNYMGTYYTDLNHELAKRGRNLHSEIRSKLVHQMALDISFRLILNDTCTDKPGLEYLSIGDSPRGEIRQGKKTLVYPAGPHLDFNIREYYRDFLGGVGKFRSELAQASDKTQHMEGTPIYNFLKAIARPAF